MILEILRGVCGSLMSPNFAGSPQILLGNFPFGVKISRLLNKDNKSTPEMNLLMCWSESEGISDLVTVIRNERNSPEKAKALIRIIIGMVPVKRHHFQFRDCKIFCVNGIVE